MKVNNLERWYLAVNIFEYLYKSSEHLSKTNFVAWFCKFFRHLAFIPLNTVIKINTNMVSLSTKSLNFVTLLFMWKDLSLKSTKYLVRYLFQLISSSLAWKYNIRRNVDSDFYVCLELQLRFLNCQLWESSCKNFNHITLHDCFSVGRLCLIATVLYINRIACVMHA